MPWRAGRRLAARSAALLALLLGSACTDSEEGASGRSTRYGIFEDLVLYRRPVDEGGPFFLDKFETTREDWWHYLEQSAEGGARTPWGEGEPAAGTEHLPVVRVSLYEARRFTHWRFGRVPRRDEWAYAATGRNGYEYPWGDRFYQAWVNDAELGLGRLTRVGTFESGRDDEGAYDLLGNAAEWTESVDERWFGGEDAAGAPRELEWAGLNYLQHNIALWPWRCDALPWPASWWVQACGPRLPRLVIGGHYLSRLQRETLEPGSQRLDGLGWLWERSAAERGDTVGVRLATDPVTLVQSLAAEPSPPSAVEWEKLRVFLARPGCREVLLAPTREALSRGSHGAPLLALLRDELGL